MVSFGTRTVVARSSETTWISMRAFQENKKTWGCALRGLVRETDGKQIAHFGHYRIGERTR
jgi:hypothetical protein